MKGGRFFPPSGSASTTTRPSSGRASASRSRTPTRASRSASRPGPFFLAASVTNGAGGDQDVLASFNGYGVFEDLPVVRNVLAGGVVRAPVATSAPWRAVYGGANLWRFTYLAEFDFIDDRTARPPTPDAISTPPTPS